MYCCIGIAFNCYCIIEHANITMCRIKHMYYDNGINMVIINDSVKYDTYLEIRLPLPLILRIETRHQIALSPMIK